MGIFWKPFPLNRNYIISEYGDVFSIYTQAILSPYITNKGYKSIDLVINGQRTKWLIHRLVAFTFIPNPNNYPIVLHKDNNKLNTHVSNLSWGTYSQNNAQAIRDGLNKVPRPDNRKLYEIYTKGYHIICNGVKEVMDKTGYDNDNTIRNYIFRNTPISCGRYSGFYVRKYEE